MEPEFGDAICFTEVPWLSHGRMLKRVQDLKEETELFLDVSGKLFPHLCVSDWMCDLAFCNDITQHMDKVKINNGRNIWQNSSLPGEAWFVRSAISITHVTYFSALGKESPSDAKKHAVNIQHLLQQELISRF
jgi:hypothetical protein